MAQMKRILLLLSFIIISPTAWAADEREPALLHPTLQRMVENVENVVSASLVVEMGKGDKNPHWVLTQTDIAVLFGALQKAPARTFAEGEVDEKRIPPNPKSAYRGLVVSFDTVGEVVMDPLHVYNGFIRDEAGNPLQADSSRYVEYWLFGTAHIREQQAIALQVLPVVTFEQCRVLGNVIIPTQPRQCLLADGNLLLEVPEPPTPASLKINSFDGCLKQGAALINTFPRRCMVAGGKVFTEPARVEEFDFNTYVSPTTPLDLDALLGLSPTAITATVVTGSVVVSGTNSVPSATVPAAKVVSATAP